MSAGSRRKGIAGEREAAQVWESHGATVRGLEAAGDHLVIFAPPGRIWSDIRKPARGVAVFHSETKRAERLKIPEWWRQTVKDAPKGTIPVLSVRQNRGEWLAVLRLDDLAALVSPNGGTE